jgi:hypothetical protein
MNDSDNYDTFGEDDPGKVIQVGEDQFMLDKIEWEHVKALIQDQQHEAVKWWADNFGIPTTRSVSVINKLHCALQAQLIA